jgi:hypothetical protein
LIDPRREDPMPHLMLDLKSTLLFRATGAKGSVSRVRAEYTVELLNLNRRVNLPKARRAHYRAYRALLREYVEEKERGARTARLRELKGAIVELPHSTVWREMQRQEALIPELHALFQAAPEALDW